MEINVDIQPDCTATLKASIPAETTAARRASIVDSYAGKAKLPGFRPGKTPKSIIEKRFKKEIEEELLDTLFETACSTALEQNPKLKVLNFGKPEQSIDEQGNYTATSTMTVVPEFELPEYKGIEVKVPSSEVTEADIEESLNSLAEQIAEFAPVDRAAKKDDVAIIDFKTTLEGKPVAEAVGKPVGFLEGRENQWMKVEDDQFLPGFASALEGLKAGDSKDITVTIPDTFPIAELRGKDLVFHTTVKEVREKELPAIDDEFAAKVLPGKTLEELKAAVKENIAQRKTLQIDEAKADQITEKLADMLDFNLPEAVVEREVYGILQQAMYSGNPPADMDKFVEDAREEARNEARRNLKVFFMLQEVAQVEKISVTEMELYNEVARQARQQKKALKAYIREIQREGRVHGIRMSLLTAKVLDFLTKEAKVSVDEQ
ncbi:trigger factor [Akkermansia sp.]|uniref:trigger factor n=1 Tax=Akkermansia sp. TaxID=1872421 RepID=UPI003A878817